MTPAQAAAIARRKNEQERAKAPLLAWAGLGAPELTAEQVVARRLDTSIASFWSSMEMAQRHAQWHAQADWLRFVVSTLLDAETWRLVACWADTAASSSGPSSHAYCRLDAWGRAYALTLAGRSPLPDAAVVHESACWADLRAAIRERRWHDEVRKHDDAGCTRDRCEVSNRARPAPRVLQGMGVGDAISRRLIEAVGGEE